MSTKAKQHHTATLTKLPTIRRDGWTPQRQAAFLRALASTHSVSAAARAVGMSRQSAYRLRARLWNQPFDMAWDAAFVTAFDALLEAAMDRAINGVEVPHYHKGELVGTSRRFDERLTVALLDRRDEFLHPPGPQWHEKGQYDPRDFHALVKRVEEGPEAWKGESAPEEWNDSAAGEASPPALAAPPGSPSAADPCAAG